ncbi:nibrin [Gastrophryne carolinensis]
MCYRQSVHFLVGTEYLVGRKNCSILIEDDQSISRAHATLSVSHPPTNLGQPDKIPVLAVKDCSKYGTFINGEKMESASSRNVKSGDKVTFGVYNSKFRVIYEPLVACSSCLNNSEKATLNQALQLLGGHIVNNWTEKCTHLVMTSIKVTIKTVCALICCKPMVKPEYFSELIKAIQKKQALPALSSFIPILDEPSLQADSLDLSENEERKYIFKDKVFLFLTSKQYKKLSPAVHFAGGKAKLVTRGQDEQCLLESPNVCVIDVGTTESQMSESLSQSWITGAMNTLQSKGLRAIPESEIGLAVIYTSTKTYCNPQQRAANTNETEKAARSFIVESTLSSSMAVNETLLPATTFNTTAYVTNTEPQDQTVNGDREDDESQPSIAKLSRVEADVSQDTNFLKDIFFTKHKDKNKPSSIDEGLNLDTEHNVSTEKFSVLSKRPNGNTEASMISSVKDSLGKRKQPGDEVVDESDLENNEDIADQMEHNSPNPEDSVMAKKRRVESGGHFEGDLKPQKEGNKAEPSQQSVRNIKTEPAIKQEPLSPCEDRKVAVEANVKQSIYFKKWLLITRRLFQPTQMLLQPKDENDDGLPNRLLLSEFRSLIVSRPTKDSDHTVTTNHKNGPNFKKFRKIAFPGAGSMPRIIGGSDLIAHDKKKNSELEQWLRQEMEEQTRQAKEQSLAEDLFRYNPKTAKRRR